VSAKYDGESARDPKVVKDVNGLFHMFLTTSLVKEGKGCLAHFISYDMESWEECEDPIYISEDGEQPECPDYFVYNGKYYLIYSLHGKAHYGVSDRPFDGFVEPMDSVIPCESVPKGAIWKDKIVFAGFRRMGGYGGFMTFKSAEALPNGELIFNK
jgi:sucrose-6-phosphate hydrolase SacC (GH32 family)